MYRLLGNWLTVLVHLSYSHSLFQITHHRSQKHEVSAQPWIRSEGNVPCIPTGADLPRAEESLMFGVLSKLKGAIKDTSELQHPWFITHHTMAAAVPLCSWHQHT